MRYIALIGMLAIGLAGCAHRPSSDYGSGKSIDPAKPQVIVSDGYLVVNQEPVVIPPDGVVTWQLPRGGKATFDKKSGITIDKIQKVLDPQLAVSNANAMAVQQRGNSELLAKSERLKALQVRADQKVNLFPCNVVDKYEYRCSFGPPNDLPRALYSYTIRVETDKGPLVLDPTVMPPASAGDN